MVDSCMRNGLLACSCIRYSHVAEPIVVNFNVSSRGNGESPEHTKAGERHRIKEEVKERFVAEGACQHRVGFARKRIMAERGSHSKS